MWRIDLIFLTSLQLIRWLWYSARAVCACPRGYSQHFFATARDPQCMPAIVWYVVLTVLNQSGCLLFVKDNRLTFWNELFHFRIRYICCKLIAMWAIDELHGAFTFQNSFSIVAAICDEYWCAAHTVQKWKHFVNTLNLVTVLRPDAKSSSNQSFGIQSKTNIYWTDGY